MRKLLLISILIFVLLVGIASALPNASFTINRTEGFIGQVSQTVLFTNTTTEPADVTCYNLSLQGTANDTVWYNVTSWTTYAYTYSLPGNFTPYLNITYSGGTNQTVNKLVNTTFLVAPAFTCSQPNGSLNLNGTRPFTVVCNSTNNTIVSTYQWYGSCLLPTEVNSTKNISMTCLTGGYKNINLFVAGGNGTNTSSSPNTYIFVRKYSPQTFVPEPIMDFWTWLADFLNNLFNGGRG